MNILQLTHLADRRGGGVAEVVSNLAPALGRRGHDVALVGQVAVDAPSEAIAHGVQLLAARSGRESVARYKAVSPQLVHSHGLWAPFLSAVLAAAREDGRPTIIAPHGMLDAWALKQRRIRKRLALASFEGRNLRRAACVHALTPREAADVRTLIPGVPVAVIPNGVSPSARLPEGEASADNNVLLYLGRIHPKKGIVELIEGFAAQASSPLGAQWRVEIAGWDDGGHVQQVEATIERHGLGDRVRLLGPLYGPEKEAALARCTAFALTSYSEGLPMAVLEAWARGRPVLMTTECNLPEAEVAGAAVICAPGADGVRQGLARLLGLSADERAEMGRMGRTLVADRYDWNRVAEQMEQLYEWVRGESAQPSFVLPRG